MPFLAMSAQSQESTAPTPAPKVAPLADAPTAAAPQPDAPQPDAPTAAAPQPVATPFAVVRATKSVNVRAGPGASFGVVDVARVGAAYAVSARNEKGDWIRLAGKAERWISASLLKLSGAVPLYGAPQKPALGSLAQVAPASDGKAPLAAAPTTAAVAALSAKMDSATGAVTSGQVSAVLPTAEAREAPAAVAQEPAAPTATPQPGPTLTHVNAAVSPQTAAAAQAKTANIAAPTVAPEAAKPAAVAVVRGANANIRSGPGMEYGVIGVAPGGKSYAIVGSTAAGGWLRLEGSDEAWLAADGVILSGLVTTIIRSAPAAPVAPVEAQQPRPTMTVAPSSAPVTVHEDTEARFDPAADTETTAALIAVTTSQAFPATVTHPRGVNLRAGPGMDFEIVGTARPGLALDIVGCDATGQWIRLVGDKERWLVKGAVLLSGTPPVVAFSR
jgi:uncharacterized protein YraI